MMSHITYEEFVNYAHEFLHVSIECGDVWNIVESSQYGGVYLMRKTSISIKNIGEKTELVPICDDHLSVDEVEYSGCENSDNVETVTIEYNIVYSVSHSVPLLCFEAYKSSGESLTLEDVWNNCVQPHYFKQVNVRKLEALTMVEHPVKGLPCFIIHPCKTAELISQVDHQCKHICDISNLGSSCEASKLTGAAYIISWLSMLGPVVGLHLPLSYFKTR